MVSRIKTKIIISNDKDKTLIQRLASMDNPQIREIPRLFLFDSKVMMNKFKMMIMETHPDIDNALAVIISIGDYEYYDYKNGGN